MDKLAFHNKNASTTELMWCWLEVVDRSFRFSILLDCELPVKSKRASLPATVQTLFSAEVQI